MIARMAKTPRRNRAEERKRRSDTGGVHAWLQVRVDPDVRELAEAGAAARNVTLARYVQSLVEADELAREYMRQKLAQQELEFGPREACAS
jgi:predicted HicB family RNase H-like nuclease